MKNISQVLIDCSCCFSLPKCPVTPLGKEIKLTWRSGGLTEGRSRLHTTVLPSFRWLQIDYVTVLHSFRTTEVWSWPFNDYEDKACLLFSEMSGIISPSDDFKDSWWLPSVMTNSCWLLKSLPLVPASLALSSLFLLNYNLPTVQ